MFFNQKSIALKCHILTSSPLFENTISALNLNLKSKKTLSGFQKQKFKDFKIPNNIVWNMFTYIENNIESHKSVHKQINNTKHTNTHSSSFPTIHFSTNTQVLDSFHFAFLNVSAFSRAQTVSALDDLFVPFGATWQIWFAIMAPTGFEGVQSSTFLA